MVGIIRYVRHIRRAGLKQWWRDMQYIGDAKYGGLKGTDQSVLQSLLFYPVALFTASSDGFLDWDRFGNRYFENLDPEDEVPGQQTMLLVLSVPALISALDPVQVATAGSITPRYGIPTISWRHQRVLLSALNLSHTA